MHFTPDHAYHLFNRGNNRGTLFFSDDNYLFFLEKVRAEIAPLCNILSWCLMPNHFHFIIQATDKSCEMLPSFGGKPMQRLAQKVGRVLSTYSQAINKQQGRTGSLFQQKTKAKPVTQMMKISGFTGTYNQYLIALMHYIHQNPYRAGLVARLEDWRFSSFRDFAGLRNGTLCQKELLMAMTDYSLDSFFRDSYNVLDWQS